MKKLIGFILMTLLVFSYSAVQADNSGYYVYGDASSATCTTWLVNEQSAVDQSDLSTALDFAAEASWVDGFISGVGAAGVKLKQAKESDIIYEMNVYCKLHPTDQLPDAASQVANDIAK